MDSVPSMVGEEAAPNLVAEETLDPASLSPTLVQLPDDAPAVPAAGSSSQSIQPPRTPDSSLSREQVTPGLQQHLAAAENRVSKALHQRMESIETKVLQTVKQAAMDIIDNLGKEAATCILLSQRKANLLEYELNCTKQQALSMLMQVKQAADAQISDAENKYLIERRRAQEAEATLHTMQESNKKLKAELKRKGQQVEFQKGFYPATAQQGLQVSVAEGSGCRRGGNSRLKGLAGEMKTQQVANARNEAVVLAMSPGATTLDHSPNGVAEVRTENISTRPLVHSLTYHDAYTDTRVLMGVLANPILRQGKSNLEGMGDLILTGDGHGTMKKLHSKQESPALKNASVTGADNISVKVHQPHSSSEDSHPCVTQVDASPSLMETGQLTSSLKVDLESRSKDSDEEKSGLTVEALYCKDESLPPQVHPVDEYQFNNTHVRWELETSDRPKRPSCGRNKYAQAADISIHCTEELEMDDDPERASTPLSNASRNPKIVNEEDKRRSSDIFEPSGAVTKGIREGFGAQDRSEGSEQMGRESREATDDVGTVLADKSKSTTPVAIPEAAKPNFDSNFPSPPVTNSVSNHSEGNHPNEDAQMQDARNEFPSNQVSKRKRKQVATVSKYDLSVTDRSSMRLEADGGGPFDLLAAAGVDAHISSRDSRRLMQGARQLFSLAESKWR